jgi:hypothetical protein
MKKIDKLNLNLRERIASVANDDDITVNFRDANYSSIEPSDVVIADQFGDGQTRFIGTSIEETMTDTLEAAKADNVTGDVTIQWGNENRTWTIFVDCNIIYVFDDGSCVWIAQGLKRNCRFAEYARRTH